MCVLVLPKFKVMDRMVDECTGEEVFKLVKVVCTVSSVKLLKLLM